jgi:hypothetical protein
VALEWVEQVGAGGSMAGEGETGGRTVGTSKLRVRVVHRMR